ncbi:MAG: nucleotidyltransferase domain-containing protein [Candidatus Wallbacteria bacterium]|nr:nucleotidyltransferase domain-containing protein [Candidatus Wallbacteria bacterium]
MNLSKSKCIAWQQCRKQFFDKTAGKTYPVDAGALMGREAILEILREYKRLCADKYGILSIGIFGSFACGTADDRSDVDVVIRLKEPELFTMAGIKSELESRFHMPVDLVAYRDDMNEFLKQRIDSGAIYV